MVTRWGMSRARPPVEAHSLSEGPGRRPEGAPASERIGLVDLAPPENRYLGVAGSFAGAPPYGEETARLVDSEVQRIIQESREEAMRLLRQHRDALEALVHALLERETLGEQEILKVTGLPAAPALVNRPLDGRPKSSS